ncbi:MAG: hypothetical protein WCW31_02930 [Patescibacteria group bacterium]|jgi:hypothetical protein
MNFSEIAKKASESGCDLITIKPEGCKTLVICERRMSSQDALTLELDRSFCDLEFSALDELKSVGWDARPTSIGIRAFGQQAANQIDRVCTAPTMPKHVLDSMPSTFAPSGIHRDGFNAPPDPPKQPKHRYYPIY